MLPQLREKSHLPTEAEDRVPSPPAQSSGELPITAQLRQLFERAPALAVVLRGPDHVVDYANPGYLQLMGGRELLGKPLHEAVAEVEAQGFIQILDTVYRTGTPFEGREVPISLPHGGTGPIVEGYYDFVYQPITDPGGRVVGIFAQGNDVTDWVLAERSLRASEARFAAIFEQVTVGIAQTDLTGRFVLVNDRQCEILGRSRQELLQLRMQTLTHPDDVGRNVRLFERMVATGEPFVVEKRYIRPDETEVWVRNNVSIQRESDGAVRYATAVVVDISERKLGEARQRLLINELNHRVKNTLATVQSLAAQAGRSSDLKAGHADFLDRLMALARAHDVLTVEHWTGADLVAIARSAFAPFDGDGSTRFTASGPAVRLGPRDALVVAMALHELATNAMKYGALSTASGRVLFSWSLGGKEPHSGKRRLSLLWREAGGPTVRPFVRRGFGSRLMESVARELGGAVVSDPRPEGMIWRLEGSVESASPDAAI